MKNLFLSLITVVALSAATLAPTSKATAQVSSMVSEYSLTSDTITNTGTAYLYAKVNGYYGVSIQITVTKISGTVAGTTVLQGSLDGTNWNTITTEDTLTHTNVSSQGYLWTFVNSPYLYYRVYSTGSGTMSALITAKIMYRKP